MRVLLLTSMLTSDIKNYYKKTLKEIDNKYCNIFSPIIFTKTGDFISLFSAVNNSKEIIFNKSIDQNKSLVFIGPAPKDIQFDYVFSIEKELVLAQEKMAIGVLESMKVDQLRYNFYSAEESKNINFKDFIDFIKKECSYV